MSRVTWTELSAADSPRSLPEVPESGGSGGDGDGAGTGSLSSSSWNEWERCSCRRRAITGDPISRSAIRERETLDKREATRVGGDEDARLSDAAVDRSVDRSIGERSTSQLESHVERGRENEREVENDKEREREGVRELTHDRRK